MRQHDPSWENPFIDGDEVIRLKGSMPERMYRQEILAEFLSDSGAVFRGHRDCVTASQPNPGGTALLPVDTGRRTAVVGIDLARTQNFTVLFGMDAKGRWTYFDRWNEISWPLQKERIRAASAILQKQGALKPRLVIDATGVGDPVVQDLERGGLNTEAVLITGPLKTQLIEGLAVAVEQGLISLPDDPVLLNEFDVFDYETTKAGRVTYQAPEGLHDDCVMAVALAWNALRSSLTVGGAVVPL